MASSQVGVPDERLQEAGNGVPSLGWVLLSGMLMQKTLSESLAGLS